MDEKFFESKIFEKKTEPYYAGGKEREIEKKEVSEFVRRELENLTAEYKKNERFKKTLENLEKIAQNQGFEGVLIDKWINKEGPVVIVGGHTIFKESTTGEIVCGDNPQDKVLINEYALENIKELFRTDEEFAKGGFADIFFHEKQHLEGPAGEILKKEKSEVEKIIEETKDFDEALEKIKEIHPDYYPKEERQAELQKVVKTYKNSKGFVRNIARAHITSFIAKEGFDKFKRATLKINQKLPGISFIKDEIINEVDEEIKRMRQMLLKKYEKLESKEGSTERKGEKGME